MSSKFEVVFSIVEEGLDTLKKATADIGGIKDQTDKLNTGMINLNATLGVAKAAFGAVSAVVRSSITESLELADALQKQAQIAGVSTTTLQEYGYAAKASGASTESMSTGLAKLTENAYNAFTGNKKLADGFQTLGVDLRDANGNFRDTNQIVNETIKKLADLPNPAQQSALAVQLLGKGGRELVPLLREGSASIDNMRKSAKDLGQVLSDEAIKNLDAAGDKFDETKTAIKNMTAEIVSSLSPALIKLAEYGTSAAVAMGRFINYNPSEVDFYKSDIDRKIKQIDTLIARQKTLGTDIAELEAKRNDLVNERDSVGANYSNQFYGQGPSKPNGNNNTIVGVVDKKDNKDKKKNFDPTGLPSQLNISYAKEQAENEIKILKDAENAKKKINKDTLTDAKNTYRSIAAAGASSMAEYMTVANYNAMKEKELAEQKRQTNIANAREQLNVITGVLQEAGSRSKAAAIAYKTLAATTTVIDTYSGAQKAFNSLASIPYVGYALGLVAAGATVAAGLLRVNEIRKQQFASGGTSIGGMARVGEMGPEDVFLPAGAQVINHHNTQQQINNQNRGATLNVTIQASDGSVAKKLAREIRSGTADWAIKQIFKAGGIRYAGA
jgi:hypothetical protein